MDKNGLHQNDDMEMLSTFNLTSYSLTHKIFLMFKLNNCQLLPKNCAFALQDLCQRINCVFVQ